MVTLTHSIMHKSSFFSAVYGEAVGSSGTTNAEVLWSWKLYRKAFECRARMADARLQTCCINCGVDMPDSSKARLV